jgi:hypothetical protein
MLRNILLQEVKDNAAGYSFVIPLTNNRVYWILPYILILALLPSSRSKNKLKTKWRSEHSGLQMTIF